MTGDIPEPDRVEGCPHPRHTVSLFGQQQAEATVLEASLKGRLHHGWLLSGPRGVGKATLAWRIARFLLCHPGEKPATLDTDPDHPVARRIAALSEPRLFLCRRPWDEKRERLKQDITVEDVRRLKSFFNLSASDGGHRVVILDAADEMNSNAANALLKILEEPPENSTLLLISHRPLSLLPTIRSRCRVLACASLGVDDIARALRQAGVDPGENSAGITELAAGSVGEAVRLLLGGGGEIYQRLTGLLSGAPGMDRTALLKLAETCTGKAGAERYDLTLRLVALLLHRLAVSGVQRAAPPEACTGEAAILMRLSPSPTAGRLWAELATSLGERTAHGRAVNLDPASVILDMLLKIDQTAGVQISA